MFFNVIIDVNHTDFNDVYDKILNKSFIGTILEFSDYVICNNNFTKVIFHTNLDITQETTQQLVVELFNAGKGCIRNLNVLNTSIDINSPEWDWKTEWLLHTFQIYLQ